MNNQIIAITLLVVFVTYIIISILVTIFNFNFEYLKKINESIRRRKKNSFITKLEKNDLKKIIRMTSDEIIALENAFSELYNQNKSNIVNKYLVNNSDYIETILKKYSTKSSIKKAFILHFVVLYYSELKNEKKIVDIILSDYLLENSQYCTANALKIIFKIGSEDDILKTILLLDKNMKKYCSKSLIEIMHSYKGNKEILCEKFMEKINILNEFFQVVIIEFIADSSNSFNEKVFLLWTYTENKEVKCSIIKYFGRHYYEPAQEFLINVLEEHNLENWEYLILSAKSLYNYKTKETVEALKKSLTSPNWYIRKNSAETLIGIIGKAEISIFKKEIQDKYAREMIEYVLQEKEFKKIGGTI